MLLDDLESYLTDAGVVATIAKGDLHDTPDTLLAMRETGGMASEHVMQAPPGGAVQEVLTLQILARAREYLDASVLIWQARRALDGLRNVSLNGILYDFVSAMQPPFLLMRDENQRYVLVFNVLIRRQTTTF